MEGVASHNRWLLTKASQVGVCLYPFGIGRIGLIQSRDRHPNPIEPLYGRRKISMRQDDDIGTQPTQLPTARNAHHQQTACLSSLQLVVVSLRKIELETPFPAPDAALLLDE